LNEKAIYIALDQPKEEMERTLFHELCHMLLFLSGHHFKLSEEDEEALVRAFEHGFLQMYKRRRIP
jgi:predicted SprT family Zn-dependent metalloprotease